MKIAFMKTPLVALALAACAKTGTGPAVRADITARMQSVQAPIAACYKKALIANRKLKGTVILDFKTKPGTGEFTGITVTRDEIGDAGLQQCVVAQVGGLKLATPQKTAVQVSYPIHFAPEN